MVTYVFDCYLVAEIRTTSQSRRGQGVGDTAGGYRPYFYPF